MGHSSLPAASHASKPSVSQAAPSGGFQQSPQSFSVASRTGPGNFNGPPAGAPGPLGPAATSTPTNVEPPSSFHQSNHSRSFSQGNMLNSPVSPQPQYGSVGPASGGPRFPNGGPALAGPPQLGALAFQEGEGPSEKSASPPQLGLPYQPPGPSAPPAYSGLPALNTSAGSKPVFGVHLGRLYERDGLAVPMVVYQCIQAVDLFGLGVEGIYRQSGSLNHINRLKSMFDSGMFYRIFFLFEPSR